MIPDLSICKNQKRIMYMENPVIIWICNNLYIIMSDNAVASCEH